WTLPPGAPLVWTKLVLLCLALPALVPVSTEIVPRRPGFSKRADLWGLAQSLLLAGAQFALTLTLLAHQAWLMADAVGRTLLRLTVTRRRMLEWIAAAQVKSDSSLDLTRAFARMKGALALAVAAGVVAVLSGGGSWIIAAPFVVLWCLSPAVARRISRPPAARPSEHVTGEERQTLLGTARLSWRFFETFVTREDHFLPPDNFQEDPRPVVAHRTSPTNLGVYLLSTTAARDLGWIGTLEALDRLGATLATMGELERFRGHFYNWYDTQTLKPLAARYVSPGDSGNLSGHLSVLAVAAREYRKRPFVGAGALAGIDAALVCLGEALPLGDELRSCLADEPITIVEWAGRLRELAVATRGLADRARRLDASPGAPASVWAEAAQATGASHPRGPGTLAPWGD